MTGGLYLIVDPIEIIATDLAMNVQDYDPSASVLIALSPSAACDVLQDQGAVRLAFVHADPGSFSKTQLANVLADRGALVVFSGEGAERKDKDVLVLHRPFCAQTTAELLQRTENQKCA